MWRFALLLTILVRQSTAAGEGRCLEAFDVSNKTIIKTAESVAKGAKFLKAANAQDRQQCEQICCRERYCNIAIFEEKIDSKRDCYLFDCGTLEDFKCSFTVHDHFVSMGLMVSRDDLEKTKIHEQSAHEMDLTMLKTKQDLQSDNSRPSSDYKGAKDTPTASDNQWNRQPDSQAASEQDMRQSAAKMVPLPTQLTSSGPETPYRGDETGGETIRVNPIMTKTIAKPESPFKPGKSPKQNKPDDSTGCSEFQWQCVRSKECIAIYDVCSGVAQCQDKSDEAESACVQMSAQSSSNSDQSYDPNVQNNRLPNSPINNGPQQQSSQMSSDQQPIDNQYNNRPPVNNGNYDRGGPVQPQYGQQQQQRPLMKPSIQASSVQQPQQLQPQQQRPNFSPQRVMPPQQYSDVNQYYNSGQARVGQPQAKMAVPNSGDSPSVQKISSVPTNLSPQKAILSPAVKLTPVGVDDSNLEPIHQGGQTLAAVLLSVSMFLLAVLLVFLCCRIRRARKLIRKKGKVLNAGEGEYLINGLYL